MIVINGEGYDSLVDAYEKGIIEPGCEIITEIKKRRRWFSSEYPWEGGIIFNRKGILYKIHRSRSDKGGKKTSLERLSVEELSMIGKWGAPDARHLKKATASAT